MNNNKKIDIDIILLQKKLLVIKYYRINGDEH